jgi:hypothetical protein
VSKDGREFGIQTQRKHLTEGGKETRDLSLLIISPGSPPVEVLSIKAPKNTLQGSGGKTITKSLDLKTYSSLKPSSPVLFAFSGWYHYHLSYFVGFELNCTTLDL